MYIRIYSYLLYNLFTYLDCIYDLSESIRVIILGKACTA